MRGEVKAACRTYPVEIIHKLQRQHCALYHDVLVVVHQQQQHVVSAAMRRSLSHAQRVQRGVPVDVMARVPGQAAA